MRDFKCWFIKYKMPNGIIASTRCYSGTDKTSATSIFTTYFQPNSIVLEINEEDAHLYALSK